MQKSCREIVDGILNDLEDLNPYIYHKSRWDSYYIKFKCNPRLNSIRIGDHRGKFCYKYKYNIDVKNGETKTIMDRGVKRHFYNIEDIEKMYTLIRFKNMCLPKHK